MRTSTRLVYAGRSGRSPSGNRPAMAIQIDASAVLARSSPAPSPAADATDTGELVVGCLDHLEGRNGCAAGSREGAHSRRRHDRGGPSAAADGGLTPPSTKLSTPGLLSHSRASTRNCCIPWLLGTLPVRSLTQSILRVWIMHRQRSSLKI